MKKIFLALLIFLTFASAALAGSNEECIKNGTCNLENAFRVYDSTKQDVTDQAADKAGYNINVKEQKNSVVISNIIAKAISTVLGFLGIIFIILNIYAGFLWMTAQGNEEKVTKAINILKTAVPGLAIVLLAYAASYYVISKLTASLIK